MSLRFSYGVAMENQGWNRLSKRKATRLFCDLKLPLGESAVLTRTHKRTGVMTVLAERYQPDEEIYALSERGAEFLAELERHGDG